MPFEKRSWMEQALSARQFVCLFLLSEATLSAAAKNQPGLPSGSEVSLDRRRLSSPSGAEEEEEMNEEIKGFTTRGEGGSCATSQSLC